MKPIKPPKTTAKKKTTEASEKAKAWHSRLHEQCEQSLLFPSSIGEAQELMEEEDNVDGYIDEEFILTEPQISGAGVPTPEQKGVQSDSVQLDDEYIVEDEFIDEDLPSIQEQENQDFDDIFCDLVREPVTISPSDPMQGVETIPMPISSNRRQLQQLNNHTSVRVQDTGSRSTIVSNVGIASIIPNGAKRKRPPSERSTDSPLVVQAIRDLKQHTMQSEVKRMETGSTTGITSIQVAAPIPPPISQLNFHTNAQPLTPMLQRLENFCQKTQTPSGVRAIQIISGVEAMQIRDRLTAEQKTYDEACRLASYRDPLHDANGNIVEPKLRSVNDVLRSDKEISEAIQANSSFSVKEPVQQQQQYQSLPKAESSSTMGPLSSTVSYEEVRQRLSEMFDKSLRYYNKKDASVRTSVPMKKIPVLSRSHIANMLWLHRPIVTPFQPCLSSKFDTCVAQHRDFRHPFAPDQPLMAFYGPEDYFNVIHGKPLEFNDALNEYDKAAEEENAARQAEFGFDGAVSHDTRRSSYQHDEYGDDEEEEGEIEDDSMDSNDGDAEPIIGPDGLEIPSSKRQKPGSSTGGRRSKRTRHLEPAKKPKILRNAYNQSCELCYRYYIGQTVFRHEQNNNLAFEEVCDRYYQIGPGEYSREGMYQETQTRHGKFNKGIFGNMRVFNRADFIPVMGRVDPTDPIKVTKTLHWDEYCKLRERMKQKYAETLQREEEDLFGDSGEQGQFGSSHPTDEELDGDPMLRGLLPFPEEEKLWIAGWLEIAPFEQLNEHAFFEARQINPYLYRVALLEEAPTVGAVLRGYFEKRKVYEQTYVHIFKDLLECVQIPNYTELPYYQSKTIPWRRWCVHDVDNPPALETHQIYYRLLMIVNTLMKFISSKKRFGPNFFGPFMIQKLNIYLRTFGPLIEWIKDSKEISDELLLANYWEDESLGVYMSPFLLFYPHADINSSRASDQRYIKVKVQTFKRNNPLEITQNFYLDVLQKIETQPESVSTLLYPPQETIEESDYTELLNLYTPTELLDYYSEKTAELKNVFERAVFNLHKPSSANFDWVVPNLKRCRRNLSQISMKPIKVPKTQKKMAKKSQTESGKSSPSHDQLPQNPALKPTPNTDPIESKLKHQARIVVSALKRSDLILKKNFDQLPEWVNNQTQLYADCLRNYGHQVFCTFDETLKWVTSIDSGQLSIIVSESNGFADVFPTPGRVVITESTVNGQPWQNHLILFTCCFRVWIYGRIHDIEPNNNNKIRYNLILLRNSHLALFRVICEKPDSVLKDEDLLKPMSTRIYVQKPAQEVWIFDKQPRTESGEVNIEDPLPSTSPTNQPHQPQSEENLDVEFVNSTTSLMDSSIKNPSVGQPSAGIQPSHSASHPHHTPSLSKTDFKSKSKTVKSQSRARLHKSDNGEDSEPKLVGKSITLLQYYYPHPERETHSGDLPDQCNSLENVNFFVDKGTASQFPWTKFLYKLPDRCCNVRALSDMARTYCEDPVFYRLFMLQLELSLKGLFEHCTVVPSFGATVMLDELFTHALLPEWKLSMIQFILDNEMLFAKATSECLCFMLEQMPVLLEGITSIYIDWFSERTKACMDITRRCFEADRNFSQVRRIIEKRLHLQTSRTIFRLFKNDFISWLLEKLKGTNNYRYTNGYECLPAVCRISPDEEDAIQNLIQLYGPNEPIPVERLRDIGLKLDTLIILDKLFVMFKQQLARSSAEPLAFYDVRYRSMDDLKKRNLEQVMDPVKLDDNTPSNQNSNTFPHPSPVNQPVINRLDMEMNLSDSMDDLDDLLYLDKTKEKIPEERPNWTEEQDSDDDDDVNLNSRVSVRYEADNDHEDDGSASRQEANPNEGPLNEDPDAEKDIINNVKVYEKLMRLEPHQYVLLWNLIQPLNNYSGIKPVTIYNETYLKAQKAAVWQNPQVQKLGEIPPNLYKCVFSSCCRQVKTSWSTNLAGPSIGNEDVAKNFEKDGYYCAKRHHRAGKLLDEKQILQEYERLQGKIDEAEATGDPKKIFEAQKELSKAERKYKRQVDRSILKPECIRQEVFSVPLIGCAVEGFCKNPGAKRTQKDAPALSTQKFPSSPYWLTPCCGRILNFSLSHQTPAGYCCGTCINSSLLLESFEQLRCFCCRKTVDKGAYYFYRVFDDLFKFCPRRIIVCVPCNSKFIDRFPLDTELMFLSRIMNILTYPVL